VETLLEGPRAVQRIDSGGASGAILRDSSYGEGDAFVVSGSRQSGVYWLMDSGMNTDSYRNYSGNFPNPDAVQEFSVQKTSFSAEDGNAMGAVVNAVTKSGANEFHGSAFEFVRNAVFNARHFSLVTLLKVRAQFPEQHVVTANAQMLQQTLL